MRETVSGIERYGGTERERVSRDREKMQTSASFQDYEGHTSRSRIKKYFCNMRLICKKLIKLNREKYNPQKCEIIIV